MIANDNRHSSPSSLIVRPDSESDLHAILHSVSQLLSEIIGCNCVALLLLNEDGQSARLYVLDVGPHVSNSPLVRDVLVDQGALTELISGRKPRYITKLLQRACEYPGAGSAHAI
jgi:hypothetical protein